MNRRRFLAVTTASLAAGSAGCTDSESEDPDPEVETVERPAPELPERDSLDAPRLPSGDEEPVVAERVENRGEAGEVHVTLTLLEDEGDGTFVGETARVQTLELDAGEGSEVTFSDLPVAEYDRYKVEARPASLTAVVRNRGEDGRVTVSVFVGAEDTKPVDERTIAMDAGEQRELRFTGTYVQIAPEEPAVEAVSQS